MKIDILRKPYGRHKKIVESIYYNNEERAAAEHALIGGERIEAVTMDRLEEMKDVILSEVSDLIDCISHRCPGSPRELLPGSKEWGVYKTLRINVIRNLLNEI